MDDYKEKYEQALEKAKICYKDLSNLDGVVATMSKDFFEEVFPELKESEDERVRKSIIDLVEKQMPKSENKKWMIAWLEKQGEQKQHLELKAGHWYFCHQAYCERADILTVKEGEVFKCEKNGIVKGLIIKEPEKYFREISTPTDKVEPKFKVGDWIINSEGMLRHILAVDKTGYQTDYGWLTHDIYDNTYHLWTIQDAKDGDVLCCENGWTCIFKSLNSNSFSSYCFMDCSKWFCELGGECHSLNEKLCGKIHPAIKEQRDLFFSKMKEAGYEWNAEKKELKKIKQNQNITDFMSNSKDCDNKIKEDLIQWINEFPDIIFRGHYKKDIIDFLEKQSDKKPVEWSEEDKIMIDTIIYNLERHGGKEDSCYSAEINWLKSLKEK